MNLDTVLILSIFLGYVTRKKMNLDTVFIFSIFLGYVIRKNMNLDTVFICNISGLCNKEEDEPGYNVYI